MNRWEPEDWIALVAVVGCFAFFMTLVICIAATS